MAHPHDATAPPGTPAAYHHGDLRNALLAAAAEVLAERGVDCLTLRECARRAGVSHAAPAHHFGDATGLLTAVATLGFRNLTTAMQAARAGITDPGERLRAIGRGYVGFAREHPAQFRLMFQSGRMSLGDPDHMAAGRSAFEELEEAVRALTDEGGPSMSPDALALLVRAWSLVHGFSHLLLEGQFDGAAGETGLDAFVAAVLPGMLDGLASPRITP